MPPAAAETTAPIADKARAFAPVVWLLGKVQSGKTSIIRELTQAGDAEIGNGGMSTVYAATAAFCLVSGAKQANAAPFAWTERRAPEPGQMACFGELSGTHCLRRAQFIDFGGASSFGNHGDHICEVFHGFLLSLARI